MALDMTGTRRMDTLRFARQIAPAIALAAALAALAPQTVRAGEAAPNFYAVAPGETHKSLQLGVGRSVIVDLPQDASEIFVGDPKVANAVVRSARRLYVAAAANGQTTIFALAADGRKIATIDVTVGRDIGELQQLLNAALPGNDINVKTVADSIILMGSVASAGEAQKALDIASGFVGTSVVGGASTGQAPSGGSGTSVQLSVAPSGTPLTGKVINSLTIRGLDQVSLKVTISEIRRDIVKQLGVSFSGTSGGSTISTSTPFSVNGGAQGGADAALGWAVGGASLKATLDAFEREGVAHTLAEPTVTAVSGESAKFLAGGTIPILNGESCTTSNVCTASSCPAALWREPELHAGGAVAVAHPVAHRDGSHRHRHLALPSRWRVRPPFPVSARARTRRRLSCRRADRLLRLASSRPRASRRSTAFRG